MADSDLYLDPSAGSPSFISIGDKCYQLVGASDTAPNTSSFDASHSDCTDCSAAVCPPSTSSYLAGSYQEVMAPCPGNNGETVSGTDGSLSFSASFNVDPSTPCYGGGGLSGGGCWDPATNEGTASGGITGGSTVRITTDFDGTTVNNIFWYGSDGVTVAFQWQRM